MPPVEQLVQDLQGKSGRARARARQLLPHHGTDAVPPMLDLVTHDDARIAQAAFDILMDVANAACAPRFDDRRRSVTEKLLTLLEPDRSQREKTLALRALALVAPAGVDLSPIAPLLRGEPILREKARIALQRMGTLDAKTLLRGALSEVDPAFQCALLQSLGELHDAEGPDVIRGLVGHPEPAVRAAVVRALAWAGDPADTNTFTSTFADATPDTRRDVLDAWLRFAEALSSHPSRSEAARQVYLSILHVAEADERLGPLAGLGQIGDTNCIHAIEAAATDAGPRVDTAAARAIEAIRGRR